MPYTYETITDADRERMKALDVKIDSRRPNACDWILNRETADFLVWIGPDREPPHWDWYALWWNAHLYGIAINHIFQPEFSTLEVVGVWPGGDRTHIPRDEWPGLADAVFECVKAEAASRALGMTRRPIPRDPISVFGARIQTTRNDLTQSPFATFRVPLTELS